MTANMNAVPWKNTLLTKEEGDQQNPINFFEKLLTDSDTFILLFDAISEKRSKVEYLSFVDDSDGARKDLTAFIVVQDQRGVNWVCPIFADGSKISHPICPLDLSGKDAETAYRSKSVFGTIDIKTQDYVNACSRGFENASLVFLGQEHVKLDPRYRLMASFYMYKSSSQH